MKKTMFITSVIMVVVLAIALTTSSLAWFSAGGATVVTAQNLKLSAVEAEAVSGLQLAVQNSDAQFTTNAIQLPAISDNVMRPACPVKAVDVSGTNKVADADFWAALQLPGGNTEGMFESKLANIGGTIQFNQAARALTENQRYMGTIFIRNSGGENCGAQCNVIFPGDTDYPEDTEGDDANIQHAKAGLVDPQIWVAVFAITRDGDNITGKQLIALEAFKGADNNNAVNMTFAAATSELATGAEPDDVTRIAVDKFNPTTLRLVGGHQNAQGTAFIAGTAVELQVYAWFDGATIDDFNRDVFYNIKLEFTKVADPNGD